MSGPTLQLGVDRTADRVEAALQRHRRAWVVGAPATGRSALAQLLAQRLADGAVLVDLLEEEETDAAIAGLLSAAGHLADDQDRRRVMRDWPSILAGISEIARGFGDGRTFIVKVPESWVRPSSGRNPWLHLARERARGLLNGLAKSDASVVWITPRSVKPHELGLEDEESEAIVLPRPENARALLRAPWWGKLADAARRLEQALPDSIDPSPVNLRLGVGITALGTPAAEVAGVLGSAGCLAELVTRLLGALRQPEKASLRDAIARFLLARRPVGRDHVESVTAARPEDLPFLCNVIGYGGTEVRVSTPVRAQLRQRLGRPDVESEEQAHRALAEHFETLDGAADVADTRCAATDAWVQKMHHRAHTGDAALDPAVLPARELYWERGRYLSIDRKDFDSAARVYEACVARFPDDAYAWHYLGFNLERAGRARRQAGDAYRHAVELDPTNPWWNGRLIQFFIRQGKPLEADRIWDQCIDNVDPEGARVAESAWLAEHFHRNVIKAWLSAGDVARAFRTMRLIPEAVLAESAELLELQEEVLDAVEADAIGESVYARAVPVAKRWGTKPRYLTETLDGAVLVRWYPGRVVDASPRCVRLVYAERDSATHGYRALVAELDSESWNAFRLGAPERASGFVELGVYASGAETKRHVVYAEQDDAPAPPPPSLSYFDRWRSPP